MVINIFFNIKRLNDFLERESSAWGSLPSLNRDVEWACDSSMVIKINNWAFTTSNIMWRTKKRESNWPCSQKYIW